MTKKEPNNNNQTIKMQGHFLTTQRRLLFELIRQADGHLDANELHRRAREKEPRFSLATVYRNLKLFKELGLIAVSNLGETHSHYEIKGTVEHHHLVCLSCGQVIEFDSPLIIRAVAKMQREKGFDITSVQLKNGRLLPEVQREKE